LNRLYGALFALGLFPAFCHIRNPGARNGCSDALPTGSGFCVAQSFDAVAVANAGLAEIDSQTTELYTFSITKSHSDTLLLVLSLIFWCINIDFHMP